MASEQCTHIRATLKRLLPDDRLEQIGEETGCFKRVRKVAPVSLFWTLVLGFGGGTDRSISNLRRIYESNTGETLVPSSFSDRFTSGLVLFLRKTLAVLLKDFKATRAQLGERFEAFKDVLLTDSTVLRLHKALANVCPGTRTNHSPAAVKLHVVMSVTSAGKSTVALSTGRTHDRRKLVIGPWVKQRLMLFDLGYYCFQLFSCIARNGGYFVSRLKENANPRIVGTLVGSHDQWIGSRLQNMLASVREQILDLEVEVSFKRRSYRGASKFGNARYRAVCIKDLETKKWHCYITNVPAVTLDAADIAQTYRARWEIELLFKELKSGYRIDHLKSPRPEVVEAFILAALHTLIVSRRLLRALTTTLGAIGERVTTGRWWRILRVIGQDLLRLVLKPPRMAIALDGICEMIRHELVDPHTKRRPMLATVLE